MDKSYDSSICPPLIIWMMALSSCMKLWLNLPWAEIAFSCRESTYSIALSRSVNCGFSHYLFPFTPRPSTTASLYWSRSQEHPPCFNKQPHLLHQPPTTTSLKVSILWCFKLDGAPHKDKPDRHGVLMCHKFSSSWYIRRWFLWHWSVTLGNRV